MAYTVEQVQQLEDALASGAKMVQYGDKNVMYQSAEAMRTQLEIMRASMGAVTTPRRVRVSHSKGLD